MKLTNEQVLQIDNYVSNSGIKYYDVKNEIIDHFATILEQKLAENPKLDFKQEIANIQDSFSDTGFKKLQEEKTKSVKNQFLKQSLQHLISFLKLPKILITVSIFGLLIFIMNFINDKETFFSILGFILIFMGFRLLFNVNMRDTKKETFLVLNMSMYFFNAFYLGVMIFNFITRYRNEESYLNNTFNYLELIVFMLLILFYWSGEHVYYQTKKVVKKQYPNVVV